MAQKWPKKDPKWPKNDQKWPKMTSNGPKMTPGFTHFFRNFFLIEKAVPQTFSLLECMFFTDRFRKSFSPPSWWRWFDGRDGWVVAKANQHYLQLWVIVDRLFAGTLMVMDDLLICHSKTPDTMIDHYDGEDASTSS